jgi:hypothetical protein
MKVYRKGKLNCVWNIDRGQIFSVTESENWIAFETSTEVKFSNSVWYSYSAIRNIVSSSFTCEKRSVKLGSFLLLSNSEYSQRHDKEPLWWSDLT